MTYKHILKELKRIDKSMELVREQACKENDIQKKRQWGYTLDYLCAYKNYIKYEKQFDERPLESSNAKKEHIVSTEVPLCKWRDENTCCRCCDGFNAFCDIYVPINE